MKIYRVTPKNNKWIIQDTANRKTVSEKPFDKKIDAENAMFKMIAADKKITIQEQQVEQGGETVVEAFK